MELCDLYDACGCPTGQTIVRGNPVPSGCYRLVTGILCMHQDGSVLIVKRHPNKRTHPNLYEASASGGVHAGETAEQAARRELAEETGIHCGQVLPLYEDRDAERLYRGFLTVVDCDKSGVRLQKEEAVDYRWATRQELAEMLRCRPSPVILHQGIIRFLGL